jgi:hypothetical protein
MRNCEMFISLVLLFFFAAQYPCLSLLYTFISRRDQCDGVRERRRSMTQLLCFQFNHYPLLQIIFSILLYSFIQFEINVISQSVLYARFLVSNSLLKNACNEEEKRATQFSRNALKDSLHTILRNDEEKTIVK